MTSLNEARSDPTYPAKNKTSIAVVFQALRVHQWPKNLFVFAALIFAQELGNPAQVFKSVVAFMVFCAASSAGYLLNDLVDLERDRLHPDKKKRPLPSGTLGIGHAVVMMAVLMGASLSVSIFVAPAFLGIVAFYLLLTFLYSLVLKQVIIIDILVVAACFVVRAMAGAIALNVAFSNWLVVCTLFLALFIGISKRRNEVELLEGKEPDAHRQVLRHYSIPYLDHLSVIVTSGTLITYTIYTCSPDVVEKLGTDKLYLTLPFVIYGLFRYSYLVQYNDGGGDPAQTIVKDWRLVLTLVLYGVTCVAIIYGPALL